MSTVAVACILRLAALLFSYAPLYYTRVRLVKYLIDQHFRFLRYNCITYTLFIHLTHFFVKKWTSLQKHIRHKLIKTSNTSASVYSLLFTPFSTLFNLIILIVIKLDFAFARGQQLSSVPHPRFCILVFPPRNEFIYFQRRT